MKRLDIITAVAMLVMSAVVYGATRSLPTWSDYAPGSAFLPLWVAVSGAAVGLLMLIAALKRSDTAAAEWPGRAGIFRVLQTVAALWLFLAVMPWLGVGLSGILFLLTLLLGVQRRPMITSLVTTAVTVGLVQGIFIFWLNVRLPQGVFGF